MARYFRRRKYCRFTADGVKEIDYKDLDTLRNTSPKPARSSRAELPAPSRITSANWLPPSSGHVIWRCCPIRTSTEQPPVARLGIPLQVNCG